MNQFKTLNTASDDELVAELKARRQKKDLEKNFRIIILDPDQYWTVTTEGDCEGRTVKNLGTFKGHLADIARSLAGKACYGLRFTPAPNPEQFKPSKEKKVNVSLDINTGTWGMKEGERVLSFKEFLGRVPAKTPFEIEEGESYASVLLIFDNEKE